MSEQRGAHRSRTFLKADIDINGGLSRLSCIVKDLSDTGARLAVSDGILLPDTFRLRLSKPDRWVQASVRWRRGEFVGVHFDEPGAVEHGEPELTDAARVRALEAEVVRLRRMLEEIRSDPSRVQQILDGAA
jgi:hypothetical protein